MDLRDEADILLRDLGAKVVQETDPGGTEKWIIVNDDSVLTDGRWIPGGRLSAIGHNRYHETWEKAAQEAVYEAREKCKSIERILREMRFQ